MIPRVRRMFPRPSIAASVCRARCLTMGTRRLPPCSCRVPNAHAQGGRGDGEGARVDSRTSKQVEPLPSQTTSTAGNGANSVSGDDRLPRAVLPETTPLSGTGSTMGSRTAYSGGSEMTPMPALCVAVDRVVDQAGPGRLRRSGCRCRPGKAASSSSGSARLASGRRFPENVLPSIRSSLRRLDLVDLEWRRRWAPTELAVATLSRTVTRHASSTSMPTVLSWATFWLISMFLDLPMYWPGSIDPETSS